MNLCIYHKTLKTILLLILFICLFCVIPTYAEGGSGQVISQKNNVYLDELVPVIQDSYQNEDVSIIDRLYTQVKAYPFLGLSTLFFVLAIIHTFMAHRFTALANRLDRENKRLYGKDAEPTFFSSILHFLGEVEIIFYIWVIPLVVGITINYNWDTAIAFLGTRNYVEPIFVVIVMIISATKPITKCTENCMHIVAKLGKESIKAWWLTLLIVGPLLGSFITEPAAMTVCALLLDKHFFRYSPRKSFTYATLALLFVNISVGGVLTNFAAPPVLMVARTWQWSSSYMMLAFGWKTCIAIVISTFLYYTFFRKQFPELEINKQNYDKKMALQNGVKTDKELPIWLYIVHILFLIVIVINNHHPVIVIGFFLLFTGIYQATTRHQDRLRIKTPILVGCFLSGLIIHGSLQGWWITVLLDGVSPYAMMFMSVFLTSFNDNAAITYLATFIPNATPLAKYFVVAGSVTGGGLTVIANAPNPAGQSLLKEYFPDGVSPFDLVKFALLPTMVLVVIFIVTQSIM